MIRHISEGRFLYLPLFLLSVSFFSCVTDAPKNIEKYYFPVEQLKGGKVYEYRGDGNDSLPTYYWYYNTLSPDPKQSDQKGEFLTGTYYDAQFNIKQLVKEEKVSNGMLLDQAFIYAKEGVGTPFKIIGNNVFPFEVTDTNAIFLYKIAYQETADSNSTTTLIRNRRYLGTTRSVFKGQKVDAIEFEVRERIENDGAGRWQYEYKGREVYAKGIGLIAVSKKINGRNVAYYLADVYDMSVLEQKAAKTLK
jgi:hypothetical protein